MKDPETIQEWQNAVDAAEAFLSLESAKMYGLITGGPKVDLKRCEEILERGKAMGVRPAGNCVERLIAELNNLEKGKA